MEKGQPNIGNNSSRKFLYLSVVIIILIAASGYFWHRHSNGAKVSYNGSKLSLPFDWKEYKATKYGFMFNYPKLWSTPQISQVDQQGIKKDQVVFSSNSEVKYSVMVSMASDAKSSTPLRSVIRQALSGNKKTFLKYDDSSYSTALVDPSTNSLGQVSLSQIINLPALNISGATVEVLLNPSNKCGNGGRLATNNSDGCFSEADYTSVSQLSKSIRPI